MPNFVKIKSGNDYLILNTEIVDSVFKGDGQRKINCNGGLTIYTDATFDDIAAALIPSKDPSPTTEEYSDSQTIDPATLGDKVTIHRRRYFDNGEMAGYMFFGVTGYAGKEKIAAIFEKLPR
ncbi:TPA: hypothetical protein ACGIZ8_000470 [Yersinia enterocolitica]|nr:hypothetical protein [Yersinia enterocolitica]ELY5237352.1 hypothetical protein [Yersinia enterocolitica]HDL7091671.1 hypothetical protein [Yersinia enterocolitica]HDL7100746.1 hypothetical protein [Yersinia enterocolitica]HDW7095641.1 hypothetical protein [Yersinia enterocolitica]